jgi:hypothetical protein
MINVKRYDIDYTKLALERIPQPIQDEEHNTWVQRLISPIVFIYNELLLFRTIMLYKLTITPQVVYLEKMLNDRYDSLLKRITIIDGVQYDQEYLFTRPEAKPIFIYRKSELKPPKYFYLRGETSDESFDFVVNVPVAVSIDVNEMKSLLNTYKLAGKYYTIQTV